MSCIEHKIGKLTPIPITESLENTANILLEGMGIEPKGYYDTRIEQLEDVGYRQFVITEDQILRVESEDIDDEDDILRASKNEDGSISFEVRFYNGGCSFTEAIKESLEKMEADQ